MRELWLELVFRYRRWFGKVGWFRVRRVVGLLVTGQTIECVHDDAQAGKWIAGVCFTRSWWVRCVRDAKHEWYERKMEGRLGVYHAPARTGTVYTKT